MKDNLERPPCLMHKWQLAVLLSPDVKWRSALENLRLWMKSPALQRALSATGYDPKNRVLTPAQVAIIFNHIGEPDYPEDIQKFFAEKKSVSPKRSK